MEWQSIETAPRDGKRILVGLWFGDYNPYWQTEIVSWDKDRTCPHCYQKRPNGRWITLAGEPSDLEHPLYNAPYTHWMPLPEPPK